MHAYRDQYATMFRDGRGVVVIGISMDPDTMLNAWAREEEFPFLFASDSGGAVGRSFGAYNAKDKTDVRYLFVIDGTGRISHVIAPFHVLDPNAYTELKAAIDSVTK